ncbi:MAG: flagellar biosynthesis protein FlgI [Porticoccaceae bacterium]|nr:flagellar biosynthesis protein FlgI [Porticoccaceae bacterium]|tara:strand:+ start:16184 stop:17335 length:1152 start_codon:yes stop_codon:yes gene_type:complete
MRFLSLIIFSFLLPQGYVSADRIKDLTDVAGVRPNQLLGFGLVAGLSGTGDGKDLLITAQQLRTTLSGLGVSVDGPISDFDLGEQLQTLAAANANKELKVENVAAVMVTSELPPFAKPGQRVDVNVSAIGVAASLRGGTLILTELRGVDGETYALAQGPLTVTGLTADAAGASVQIGVPTSARIPNGALVERMVPNPFEDSDHIVLNIRESDFSTSNAISAAINENFGSGVASPIDGVSIAILAPRDRGQRVGFMSMIENLEVTPGEPPARVVINSRTGTAVINRSVRVTAAAVTHGTISVSISATNEVSQPGALAGGNTALNQNAEIRFEEGTNKMVVFQPGVDLREIVDAINQTGASPSSIIAILEALKTSGSLRAELVII